jgi:sugar lactone lactonase YvrE
MTAPYYFTSNGLAIRTVNASGIINTLSLTSTDPIYLANGGFTDVDCLVLDSAGNIYVCDAGDGAVAVCVYKVSPSGVVTRIAGFGAFTGVTSGVPGPALSATLVGPASIALDAAGNVYFSDSDATIICLNTQATTQTILGVVIPSGHLAVVVGVPGSYGYSGDGGQATSAETAMDDSLAANYIAIDGSGNLIFADAGNNRVRKVLTTGIISTIAGNGSPETINGQGDGGAATSALLGPYGLALDSAGNLYLADGPSETLFPGSRIRVVNLTSTTQTVLGVSIDPGIIKSVAGTVLGHSGDGGQALSAEISAYSLTLDSSGTVWMGETDGATFSYIRAINTSGIIETVAGTGPLGVTGDTGPAINAEIEIVYNVAFAASSPPPPPPPSPAGRCAAVDDMGTPVNGVYVADLSLFIIPSTALYTQPVPNSAITVNEDYSQGRPQIVLDFNDSDGLYARDLGTIFTWPISSGTILDVWQPTIIPFREDIYNRLSFHFLIDSLQLKGWGSIREFNFAFQSETDLTLLLTFDTGAVPQEITITIPNSGGDYAKVKITAPVNKFKMVEGFLSSAEPFSLWTQDCELKLAEWGRTDSYRIVKPFVG